MYKIEKINGLSRLYVPGYMGIHAYVYTRKIRIREEIVLFGR